MYEAFKIKSSKPIPKISSILKNPKIFQKPQNLGFKTWNACKWEKRDIPSEEQTLKKLENHLGKRFGVKESDLGGEETKLLRERLREMKIGSHKTYI